MGLDPYYALSAAKSINKPFKGYLYDAWNSMKEEFLLESEKSQAGNYAFTNLEKTQKNLSLFGVDVVTFNKGYIPDVFEVAQNPDKIVWLYIDLNSCLPTVETLNYFWEKLEGGGVILFDDYAWPECQDTQIAVEKWSSNKDGILFHLPTGQAMFMKNKH